MAALHSGPLRPLFPSVCSVCFVLKDQPQILIFYLCWSLKLISSVKKMGQKVQSSPWWCHNHTSFYHQWRGVSMDLVIMFSDVGEKMCHIYLPGICAAVAGPLHKMNSVASQRPAEDFGAGADNVPLSLCKHWGPADWCVLIAAMSEDTAAWSAGWIPSLWRETAEPSASSAPDLIPRVRPITLGHWVLFSDAIFISSSPLRCVLSNLEEFGWIDSHH